MARAASVLFVGVALMLGTGCQSVEESMSLRKPTAQLMGMHFKDADSYGVTVVFDVQIVNHYSTELPLRRFSYSVSSRGQRFMAGTAALAMQIPFAGCETVSLPARVDYADTLRRLGGPQPGATIPYEAQLELVTDTLHFGMYTLSLSKVGEVTLPQVSGVEPEKSPSGAKPE